MENNAFWNLGKWSVDELSIRRQQEGPVKQKFPQKTEEIMNIFVCFSRIPGIYSLS